MIEGWLYPEDFFLPVSTVRIVPKRGRGRPRKDPAEYAPLRAQVDQLRQAGKKTWGIGKSLASIKSDPKVIARWVKRVVRAEGR